MVGISGCLNVGRDEATCSELCQPVSPTSTPSGPQEPHFPHSLIHPTAKRHVSSALICFWDHWPQPSEKVISLKIPFSGRLAPLTVSAVAPHPLKTSLGVQGDWTAQWSVACWEGMAFSAFSGTSPWMLESNRNGSKTQIWHLVIWGKLPYLFQSQITQL